MRIDITQEDIDNVYRMQKENEIRMANDGENITICARCPTALALRRIIGKPFQVSFTHADLGELGDMRLWEIKDEEARALINNFPFRNKKAIKPISFEFDYND